MAKNSNKDSKKNKIAAAPAASGAPAFAASAETPARYIMQNRALNMWASLDDKTDTVTDRMGIKTVKAGALSALINSTDKLGVAEVQTLDYLNATFREQPNHDNTLVVKVSTRKYAADRGLHTLWAARKYLTNELNILKRESVTYTGSDKDRDDPTNRNFANLGYIAEFTHYRKGDYFAITFTPSFQKMLTTDNATMPMPYSPLLSKLNPRTENSAFRILRALLLNKITEYGKKGGHEDRMSVRTLLAKCKHIPSVEKVMKGNGAVDERIIQPFFNAVERIASPKDGDIETYNFIDGNGHIINTEDYANLTYQQFINLTLVIVKWRWKYPDEQVKKWKKKRQQYRNKAITAKHRRNRQRAKKNK